METELTTTSQNMPQPLLASALWNMRNCSDTVNSILRITIKSGSLLPDGHLPTEMKGLFYKLREELRLTLQDVSDYLSYVATPTDKVSNTITSVTMDGLVQDFLELKSDT